MRDQEKRDLIAEVAPEAILFDNPDFDGSIIGITSIGAVVYDLGRMVEELARDDNIDLEAAMEFIDYNTLRSLSYCQEGQAPVIVDRSWFEE